MRYVTVETEKALTIPGYGTEISYEICLKGEGPDGELGEIAAFTTHEDTAYVICAALNAAKGYTARTGA